MGLLHLRELLTVLLKLANLVMVAIQETQLSSRQAIMCPRDLVIFGDSPFKKELLTLKVSELGLGDNTGDKALIRTGNLVTGGSSKFWGLPL
jgi:hypothetical protein